MSTDIHVSGKVEDVSVKSSDEIAAKKVAASVELLKDRIQKTDCGAMVRTSDQTALVRSSISEPGKPGKRCMDSEHQNKPSLKGADVGVSAFRPPLHKYVSASSRYQPSKQYQVTGHDKPFEHPFESSGLNPPKNYYGTGRRKLQYSRIPEVFVGSRSQNHETQSTLCAAAEIAQSTEQIGQDFLHTQEDTLQQIYSSREIAVTTDWQLKQPRIIGVPLPGDLPVDSGDRPNDSPGDGVIDFTAQEVKSVARAYSGAWLYRHRHRAKVRKQMKVNASVHEIGSYRSHAANPAPASMAGITELHAASLEYQGIRRASHYKMLKDFSMDYVREIDDDPYKDNLAISGIESARKTAARTYTTTQHIKQLSYHASKAAQTAGKMSEQIICHAKNIFSNMAGLAIKAAPILPVVAVIIAILIVVSAISSIVPTVSLKTDNAKLTELYAYCTELDAKFSESVSEQLNRSGFDRIDFYENGAKSTGNHIWCVETDLDMLLAYYDAMFEDYSSNRNFQSAKTYSKNLWEQLYTLSISTHTERKTIHHSDGSTGHRTIHVLDIYVDTKSLSQLAASNAKPEGEADIKYDNVFDTPFGYLTDSQQDTFDALAEIGTFTALEEISNPFVVPNSDEEISWTVGRRYGYYINMLTGEYHPKFNSGLYLNAPSPSGAKVYAGISGRATVQNDTVIIKSGAREVTYGNLTGIEVSSGSSVKSGALLGTIGNNSPISTPALYMEYEHSGKEINPRFVVGGCSGSTSSIGNGDIVAVALSQVGTIETPVNQVIYNDWYYGRHVSGSSYPWCAVFVSWCADQCGYIDAGIIPKQAGCDQMKDWFAARGQFHWRNSGYRPKAGDLILYGTPSDMTHIGIVVSSDDSKVYTVEGNTSKGGSLNPNGGGVWTKSYALSSSYIQGYCTPAYPATGNDSGSPPAGAQKLGTFKITHYCPGACCNGQWSNVTATGAVPTPGITIAVDPKVIPLNSKVYIEGYGTLSAQDTGGAIKGNRIDVLVATHAEANRLGVVYRDVYLVH